MPNQTEARQHRGRWTELQVPKLETGEILSRGKDPLAKTGSYLIANKTEKCFREKKKWI